MTGPNGLVLVLAPQSVHAGIDRVLRQLESVGVDPVPLETVEITYYAKLEALDDENATNWLLSSHPDVYLYSALLHAAPYLQDDPRVSVWGGLAQQAVSAANLESEKARYSGTGIRMKLRSF